MSKPPHKAADFLKAMQHGDAAEPPPKPEPAVAPPTVVAVVPKAEKKAPPRAGLKHFGGYLDDDTLEKIALLRVRLRKDNSELIKLVINDLHAKHLAKRAFGDA